MVRMLAPMNRPIWPPMSPADEGHSYSEGSRINYRYTTLNLNPAQRNSFPKITAVVNGSILKQMTAKH